jgi:hypothetical protein
MQQRPDDRWSNPLCPEHHRTGKFAQHKVGELDFWVWVGIDPFGNATKLWVESGGMARASEIQPVKKPRKVKARKPAERRAKIAAPRRSIPGRRFDGTPTPSRSIA